MATVPNTTTFTFLDVRSVLPGSPNDLISAFGAATDAHFDPAYKGSQNSLLNFRNYDTTRGAPSLVSKSLGYNAGMGTTACMVTPSTYYVDNAIWASATQIWQNVGGTIAATAGYYSDGSRYRYWNGASLTGNTLC